MLIDNMAVNGVSYDGALPLEARTYGDVVQLAKRLFPASVPYHPESYSLEGTVGSWEPERLAKLAHEDLVTASSAKEVFLQNTQSHLRTTVNFRCKPNAETSSASTEC